MLKTELAFYVGCLNLHDRLAAKGEPVCFPAPALAGERKHRFSGLYDVCLSLHMEGRVVGNSVEADGKNLTIITGANQGGKSSFLRSIGLAQLMMQCGMFVGARVLRGEPLPSLVHSLPARRGCDDEKRKVRRGDGQDERNRRRDQAELAAAFQ